MRCISICAALMMCASCGHPWFQSRQQAPADQRPELTAAVPPDPGTASDEYLPGTPSWVPLIDACMREGGSRGACIDALPPEEKAALEQWEQETAAKRRELLLRNRQPDPMHSRCGSARLVLPISPWPHRGLRRPGVTSLR